MLSLDQIKQQLRNLLTEDLTKVFEEVKAHVPEGTKKFDTFLLLQGRYADLLEKVQRGVISTEEQGLEINRIREQLLVWIDGLGKKDLETGNNRDRKEKKGGGPMLIVGAILFVVVMVWAASLVMPFGPLEKSKTVGVDTSKMVSLPDSALQLPEVTIDRKPVEKQQEHKKAGSDQSLEKFDNKPNEAPAVEVKLNVLALWKDSDIMVDDKTVAPMERIGTYIRLSLSPGSHKIRLISGEESCEKNVTVREEGQVIRVICD